MDPLVTLALVFTLAVAAESGVEIVFGPLFKFVWFEGVKPIVLPYVAVAAGIFLTIYYQVDMIAGLVSLTQGTSLQATMVGYVLTGLIVSRGSNAVHDFVMKIVASKLVSQAEAKLAAIVAESPK